MNRIGKLTILFTVVVFAIIGCSSISTNEKLAPYKALDAEEGDNQVEADEGPTSLTIWAPAHIFVNQIQTFGQMYPDVELNVVEIDQSEMIGKYIDSIGQKQPPDIILINDGNLGDFSGIDGFVDLLGKQEADPVFFEKLPRGLFENYKSFHEDKMFAMPILNFPYVTYYRADILEKEGFPSDPEQLAIYLQDQENWIELARALKESGHYIFESTHSLLSLIHRGSNYFDKELGYILGQWTSVNRLDT
ncbi:ABC transporter substrate-binding protein [Marinicrinis lubricantis]|uniref:ABC transporter substrate-binding protein n=1 Tax=Marinicrinis lubricantis TaxID=2086470 RepID=A0ABW1IN45_9BACL